MNNRPDVYYGCEVYYLPIEGNDKPILVLFPRGTWMRFKTVNDAYGACRAVHDAEKEMKGE